MKNILIFFEALFLLTIVASCKKGEDDPAFSLLSRKARVAGEWKMQSGTAALHFEGSKADPDENYVFEENKYVWTVPSTGKGGEGVFKLNLTCDKDGSFSFEEEMGFTKVEASGTWDFGGGVGENKKKEYVHFSINSISGASIWLNFLNKSTIFFTYKIKELRNKKMVLTIDQQLIGTEKSKDVKYFVTAEYTFVQ